jgi:hypothetical protein
MSLEEKVSPIVLIILAVILVIFVFSGLASSIIESTDSMRYPNALDGCTTLGRTFNVSISTTNCSYSENATSSPDIAPIKPLPFSAFWGRSGFVLILVVIMMILVVFAVIMKLKMKR